MELGEGFPFGMREFRGECERSLGLRDFGRGFRGNDGSTSDLNSEEALLDL